MALVHQHTAAADQREAIVQSCASSDVQFFWTILSVDIESESQASEVLKEIIGLWLYARGFDCFNQRW